MARHRARKRQCDVAVDAGVGRNTVMEVENGDLDRVRIGELVAIGACLDLRLMLDWRSNEADLHALTDTGHAALVEAVVRFLTGSGWICHVEALSGSGSIDVLAFHTASRSLLVVEVKTRIVDIQRTLREIRLSGCRSSGRRREIRLGSAHGLDASGDQCTTVQRRLVIGARRDLRLRLRSARMGRQTLARRAGRVERTAAVCTESTRARPYPRRFRARPSGQRRAGTPSTHGDPN